MTVSNLATIALSHVFGYRMSTDEMTLQKYSGDFTETARVRPDVVVWPSNSQEVQKAVSIANRYRIPIVPVMGRANGWGLHIPYSSGIVIDLSRMKKILKIDRDRRYCVIEPGVTTGRLFETLKSKGFYIPIPSAPPNVASMLANTLIHGFGHQPYKSGIQSELVTSLEAVLPNGKLVRLGSRAFNQHWGIRGPVPDLCGLFLGWCGASGIVTKVGLQIFKLPKYVEAFCFGIRGDLDQSVCRLLMDVLDLEVVDDLSGYSRGHHFVDPKLCRDRARDPNLFFYAKLSAESKDLLNEKSKLLANAISQSASRRVPVEIIQLSARQNKEYLMLPSANLSRVTKYQKNYVLGSTSPSVVLPLVSWPKVYRDAKAILAKHNVRERFRMSAFRGSRYGLFMQQMSFDLSSKKELTNMRTVVRKLVEAYLAADGLVWKAPPWVWRREYENADKQFPELLRMVKRALDPNRVMHPGQLGI